jgi:peptidyl-prolyl cis-trans isomerase A (cyclophilin A)
MSMRAIFHTSKGSFEAQLMPQHAPKTVDNFVGLATGKKEWRDPRDRRSKSEPLYDGTVFHRVIPGFMIQGGDPEGTGRGGPGYQFEDETPPGGPRFDAAGKLAMANAGPGTNGSQFFITVAPTPHLDGKHTIFGEITDGMDVVEAIAAEPTGRADRPRSDVVLERVEIVSAGGRAPAKGQAPQAG